jgi:hypothetical protein
MGPIQAAGGPAVAQPPDALQVSPLSARQVACLVVPLPNIVPPNYRPIEEERTIAASHQPAAVARTVAMMLARASGNRSGHARSSSTRSGSCYFSARLAYNAWNRAPRKAQGPRKPGAFYYQGDGQLAFAPSAACCNLSATVSQAPEGEHLYYRQGCGQIKWESPNALKIALYTAVRSCGDT